jgi:cobalamin biosynthesis protein CobT
LSFTEDNLDKLNSTLSTSTPEEAVSEDKKEEQKSVELPLQMETEEQSSKDEYLPDGTEFNDAEAITEPNTEKIKDIVAQMPPETDSMDTVLNNIFSENGTPTQVEKKKDTTSNGYPQISVDYDNLPDFEPLKKQQDKERPRSLNDRLKKGINIGLNERLAFIRHLFDGNTSDYNRVISQLNTFDSIEEAKKFIQLVVKPDYKNWVGKEEHENKFMELVENKFSN